MDDPHFERMARGYRFAWPDVVLQVSRIREEKGQHRARVTVLEGGADGAAIDTHTFTIDSSVSRSSFAKSLHDKQNSIPWRDYIDAACIRTLLEEERGEPFVLVTGAPRDLTTSYLVRPLLVRNALNMVFGDGESGKSIVAQALAYLLHHGGRQLGFDFEPCNVLYLDYETEQENFEKRIAGLAEGFGLGEVANIHYRRCLQPLADDIEDIRQMVLDFRIELVIVDSYGMAVGGDAIGLTEQRALFAALRSLGVTVLGVHHEPVIVQRERGAKPTPYGGRYWFNEHRWIWWVKASDPDDSGSRTISLHHTKANVGPRWRRPIGLILTWKDDVPTLTRDDNRIADSPELTEKMNLKDRIAVQLRRGKLSVKTIAENLDAKPDSVEKSLKRNRTLFVRTGDEWGLLG